MTRTLHGLGALCLFVGCGAWLWELLALQSPSSPWHLPGIPSVLSRLATHAWTEGSVLFALSAHSTRFSPRSPRARLLFVSLLYLGTFLTLGSLLSSAWTAHPALQFRDTEPFSLRLLQVRAAGQLALFVALGWAVRALLKTPANQGSSPSDG